MSKANPIIQEMKKQRASQKSLLKNFLKQQNFYLTEKNQIQQHNNKNFDNNNLINKNNLPLSTIPEKISARNSKRNQVSPLNSSKSKSPRNDSKDVSPMNNKKIKMNQTLRFKKSIEDKNIQDKRQKIFYSNKKLNHFLKKQNEKNQFQSKNVSNQYTPFNSLKSSKFQYPNNFNSNQKQNKYDCKSFSYEKLSKTRLSENNITINNPSNFNKNNYLSIPPVCSEYILFLEKQNIKNRSLIERLMQNIKYKDQLLDQCQQQIIYLKKMYQNSIKNQINDKIILSDQKVKQNKDEKVQKSIQRKQEKQENLDGIINERKNKKQKIIYYTQDSSLSLKLHQTKNNVKTYKKQLKQQVLTKKQLIDSSKNDESSSFSLSNSLNNFEQPTYKNQLQKKVQIKIIQSQKSECELQQYENKITLQAKKQIQTTKKDIQILKQRINTVMTRHNSLSNIRSNKKMNQNDEKNYDWNKLFKKNNKENIVQIQTNKINLIGGIVKNIGLDKGKMIQTVVTPVHRLMNHQLKK